MTRSCYINGNFLETIDFEFYLAYAVLDADVGVDLVDKAFFAVDKPPVMPVVRDVGDLGNGGEATDAIFLAIEEEIDEFFEERIDVTT